MGPQNTHSGPNRNQPIRVILHRYYLDQNAFSSPPFSFYFLFEKDGYHNAVTGPNVKILHKNNRVCN